MSNKEIIDRTIAKRKPEWSDEDLLNIVILRINRFGERLFSSEDLNYFQKKLNI